MRTASVKQVASAVAAVLLASPALGDELRDLHFGEVLYYAYQERYFEAIQRLDAELDQHYGVDEPELDPLYFHIDQAEFAVGDFELHYRMHQRAGRAIQALLESNVEEPVRNEAAFRLARIHFQKGQPHDALRALAEIDGEIPGQIRDEVEFLRANVYMAVGRASDAVEALRPLQDSEELAGFATYNLGIALLQEGQEPAAIRELDRVGQTASRDPGTLAIRDKSNLLLGTLLFESSEFATAQQSLDRVRLEGPFSNHALLRAGWAEASGERFERALVPWGILATRDTTDAAVQEAILALPYAYAKLDVHGRAAVLYGQAVEVFGDELAKLDASLESVRAGEFLKALVQEEIRRDKDWVIRLRRLPEAPETFYLTSLVASHDFHTALQNYLDLEDLRKKLVVWQRSLDAFEDLVGVRRDYYEPRLPEIDRQFRMLDARIRLRLEQRMLLDQRLQALLVAPRPASLVTADEQRLGSRLDRLEARLDGADSSAAATLRLRIRRLRGALTWRIETEYHQRLTDAHAHLHELNEHVDALMARYDAFVRARQAAVHGYLGYEGSIDRLRGRVVEGLARLDVLMARQGHVLESVAVRELRLRRERMVAHQNQARFAFADSYDRAAKAQVQ